MLAHALGIVLFLGSSTASHERMVALLRALSEQASREHPYLEDVTASTLRDQLARVAPDGSPGDEVRVRFRLGEAELSLGRLDEAIEQLQLAERLVGEAASELGPGWRNMVLFRLGVAHLAQYQAKQCRAAGVTSHCTWPIARRDRTSEADNAVQRLEELLDRSREPSPAHFAARWLLNVAHMTRGSYPDGVPHAWLVPLPQSEDGAERFPRFVDAAPRAGVDTSSLSGSVVADDLDRDGDVDLMVSVYPLSDQIRLLVNEGGLRFEDRTSAAGLTGLTGGLNMVQGDYDNDGDIDIFVLRGAWAEDKGRHPNSLLRNNGDGTFTDVTFELGLGEVHYPTQTASWADYDSDGDLDLYVGNETSPRLRAPSQLFRNDGRGFVDVAAEAGVTNMAFAKAVVWGDYDGDDDPDLFVSNLRGANRLYRNEGNGTFTDVAATLGVTGPEASFPSWFWDVDNDGHLDIYSSAYVATLAHLSASALGIRLPMEFSRLYRNDGRGGFQDTADRAALQRPSAPMGANFGDLDGDGFLDFYLGTGYPNFADIMPNVLYRNVGGSRFVDVTAASGLGHLQKGHGIAFADLDRDGDNDVFEQMGGGLRGDIARDVLYENPGFGHRWLRVTLVGRTTNRAALGARIHVAVRDAEGPRSIYRNVTSGASFGANPLTETIGLGPATSIEQLEIDWPASGETEVFRNVPLDRDVVLLEGSGDLLHVY